MNKTITAETIIKIPFFDVDPMNIVWHGHYVKYFEMVRCELLDKIGYGYHEMALSGYGWPVVELHVRYVKPATLGKNIKCTAEITEYENRLKISYEIHCVESGDRLTKGHTVQVAVDLLKNEMQLVSPKILFKNLEKL